MLSRRPSRLMSCSFCSPAAGRVTVPPSWLRLSTLPSRVSCCNSLVASSAGSSTLLPPAMVRVRSSRLRVCASAAGNSMVLPPEMVSCRPSTASNWISLVGSASASRTSMRPFRSMRPPFWLRRMMLPSALSCCSSLMGSPSSSSGNTTVLPLLMLSSRPLRVMSCSSLVGSASLSMPSPAMGRVMLPPLRLRVSTLPSRVIFWISLVGSASASHTWIRS